MGNKFKNIDWKNTNVARAAGMLDISDDLIRQMSSGEVKRLPNYDKPDDTDGTLLDPKIFGSVDDESMPMGHIELAMPIVNIKFTRGENRELYKVLGLEPKELEWITYNCRYVVADPGTSGCKKFELVDDIGRKNLISKKAGAKFLIGAYAIEAMLEDRKVPDRGKYVLHTIPVMPIGFRMNAKGQMNSLHPLYRRLIMRNARILRLKEMEAPDVIMLNEHRLLQESADSLINNGARGYAHSCLNRGYPYESLEELYHVLVDPPEVKLIHELQMRMKLDAAEEIVDHEKFLEIFYEYQRLVEEAEEDDPNALQYLRHNEEESEKTEINRLYDRMVEMLEPLICEIIKENFSEYEKFHEDLRSRACYAISISIANYEPDKGSITDYLAEGMFMQMRYYVDKQLHD